jgi:class 3 adenylate cyclase/tetratricopeptide (TPR) repeat protein
MALACAVCASEIAPGARFCSACGTPQVLECPTCGTPADAAAAFCSACGASLRDGAPKSPIADEREERRVVTVLFADVAGWTALAERLDPEDVRVVQGELFELVNGQVELHGGITEKFVGDAVLAVFGIPQAHEDDPERAVRAAIAVRDDFSRLASELERRHGAAVGLRIGVNTGDVVSSREAAARGELVVSGDAVNVAARLQQAAKPGEVLVGERTRAGTSRVVRYEDRGGIEARGKSSRVPAWAAVAVASRPQRRGIEGLSAPMVGRDEELAVLQAVAARVVRERVPQLVTLFGPAGVGKSRLLAELVERTPDLRLLKGGCLPYGDGITYWPLAQVAKDHAGILESDPAERALHKLAAAVAAVVRPSEAAAVIEAAAWTIGFSLPGASSADLQSGEVRARLYGAWRRYVAALGRERPTVLAIEDIHWASEPLLDLLDHLADTLSDTSVLVVCPARVELLETRPAWGAGKQNAIALNLSPLRPDDARRLVTELLDEDRMPDAVRERILERADGNPFYLEEILRMLIEQGSIERSGDGWIATGRLDDVPIPDSVHGVIAARIDLLDAGGRDALRRCSPMGRSFWPAAVGVDEAVVEALGRRGLVLEQPLSAVEGMREFTFKHALTRDVAYESLPRPERRELHRLLGEWIEQGSIGRKGEAAEIAAYHFGEAIRYGDDDPALGRRAFALLLASGEAAITRAAIQSARGLFERALALAPDDRGRYDALVALARCAIGEIRYDRAADRLEEAGGLATELGDPWLRSEALGWLSRLRWLDGRWDDAIRAADEGVAALEGLPESSQLATALARRSQLEMLRGVAEAEPHAEEAIAVAQRVGNEFAEVNGRVNLFTARASRGIEPDPAEIDELLRRTVEAELWDELYRVIVNYLWSASAHVPIPALVEAVRRAEAHLSGGHSIEFGTFAQYMALSRAKLLWVPSGEWARVDEEIAASGTITATGSNWLVEREILAGMALRRGDVETADGLLVDWMEVAMASNEPQRIIPMASVALARATLAGDAATIRQLTARVLDTVLERHQWAPLANASIPRAAFASGDVGLLRRLEDELAPSTKGARFACAMLVTAAGLRAILEDRVDEAVRLLGEVVRLERERGARFTAACAELDLALAHERAGNDGAAAEARERAAAVLVPLGCVNAIS